MLLMDVRESYSVRWIARNQFLQRHRALRAVPCGWIWLTICCTDWERVGPAPSSNQSDGNEICHLRKIPQPCAYVAQALERLALWSFGQKGTRQLFPSAPLCRVTLGGCGSRSSSFCVRGLIPSHICVCPGSEVRVSSCSLPTPCNN